MTPQARRRPLAPLSPDAREHAVSMRDGVLLATDVYLPNASPPFDVLLSRLPYDKSGDEFFMPDIARFWTARGYAIVVQDVRGKARSGGDFDPTTPDIDDGYDTIDWIVAQPWARGGVAMIGDSYAGYTQWAAAASGHPALLAITPRCTTHDRNDLMFDGGVFGLESAVYWAAETAIDEYLYDFPEPFDWSLRPVREVLTDAVGRRRPDWIDHWATRSPHHEVTAPTVPSGLRCLHLCGLYDYAAAAQMRTWELARSTGNGAHYLVLDAVDHSWRGLVRGSAEGLLESPPGFLDRYNEPIAEFLAAVFADQAYEGPPVRWRTTVTDEWRRSMAWPPPEATAATWWFGPAPDGLRLERAITTAEPAAAAWTHDPDRPVPSRGNPFHELAVRFDLSDLADRPDVVVAATAPLDDPLTLAGTVTFTGRFEGSSEDAHLFVMLLDIDTAGRATEVGFGRQLATAPWPQDVSVQLGPVAYDYCKGHRMAVQLSPSLFPRCALNSGTTHNTWDDTTMKPSNHRVILGGSTGARITGAILTTP